MDLKHSIGDGEITYWYGEGIKHTTSLKLWGDVGRNL